MKRIRLVITLFLMSVCVTYAQKDFKQSLSGVKYVKIEMDAKINLVAGGTNELVISENKNDDHDYDYDYDSDEEKKAKFY